MKAFQDKVAVITGGASGIGFALAKYGASEGMKLVIADVEDEALAKASEALQALGAEVLACKCDVSKAEDVANLAKSTIDRFGSVDLLFNNAGVGGGSTIWESTLNDWEWVLGVNLMGVVHGLREFVPRMLAQDTECHIVNTASIAGLIAGPGLGIYKVTKHAVVTMSETLYYELARSKIGVSVLCPAWVKTKIGESERNRPEKLSNSETALRPEEEAAAAAMDQLITNGMSPDKLAKIVFDAIRGEQLYILTHPESTDWVAARFNAILEQRNPPKQNPLIG